MRNRVTNYLTKVSNNQIKAMVDRQKFIENDTMCESAMEELKAIYWHEKELLIVIPMLISNATTFELVETLTVHIKYIREHVKHLEQKFPEIHQMTVPKTNLELASLIEQRQMPEPVAYKNKPVLETQLEHAHNFKLKNSFEKNIMNIYSINMSKNTILR